MSLKREKVEVGESNKFRVRWASETGIKVTGSRVIIFQNRKQNINFR